MDGQGADDFRQFTEHHRVADGGVEDRVEQLAHLIAAMTVNRLNHATVEVKFLGYLVQQLAVIADPGKKWPATFIENLGQAQGKRHGLAPELA